jgi:pSer/pThr/pTyr-binding forkhead associated (FHA) protein
LLDPVNPSGIIQERKMTRAPVFVVQLIHIQGPLKGEIFAFSERRTSGRGVVSIGRHPSCHVRFPATLTSISRKHADIIREGNQFTLVDRSANGTFVNGKRVKKTVLKNGDVLEFSEKGPKVSFLAEMQDGKAEFETLPPPPRSLEEPQASSKPEANHASQAPPEPPQEIRRKDPKRTEIVQPAVSPAAVEKPAEPAGQNVKVPLSIQYGPTLRSFKELPITIGKSPKSNFVIDHPAIYDQHAQIFFSQSQYWAKDLTGQRLLHLNRQPIGLQAPLKPNDDLALSPRGPVFRFLGDGRLAEAEEPSATEPQSPPEKGAEESRHDTPEAKESKKVSSVLKKFFKH